MKPVQKYIYGLIALICIVGAGAMIFQYMLWYHVCSILLFTLFGIVVLYLGDSSMSTYNRYVLLGLLFFMIGDILLMRFDLFPYVVLLYCFSNLSITAAFLSFQGYTYNTFRLIVVLLIVLSFYMIAYENFGDERSLVILYLLSFTTMVWQGLNLFKIRKSKGNLLILAYCILFIIASVLRGFHIFLYEAHALIVVVQMLFWTSNFLLAHTTTIKRVDFRKII